jgi:hypothetical protein
VTSIQNKQDRLMSSRIYASWYKLPQNLLLQVLL